VSPGHKRIASSESMKKKLQFSDFYAL